jgi:uncharacterized protein YbjT (DUF2867 family)
MKIVVTGSLGHISQPLTQTLLQKGHAVTVISSKPERQTAIEALGATAAIGTVEDVNFLTAAFADNDAVYTMLPPESYNDPNLDLMKRVCTIVDSYGQAIEKSGVKRVVHLSSVGAHMDQGNGLLIYHHIAETRLKQLTTEVALTFMRPTAFYYNLYGYVGMIKQQGVIAANYGADDMSVWVSPIDIAAAVAEELETPVLSNRQVRYVASDELTCNKTARILGAAIGKPDLKWIVIPNEQMQSGLIAAGMKPDIAAGMVEMYAAHHRGILSEDYYRNRPALGNVKLTDFAQEFAAVYNKS